MFAAKPLEGKQQKAGRDLPQVWLVLGDKLGDNAQAQIIAEALGWPVESKQLRFLEPYVFGKPHFEASLHHIDRDRSDPLQPPWPDLVITIGRRPAMAALWVRDRSGARTKVALIGRPKRRLNQFDLVIATPQYSLPQRPNVLRIDLPLMRVDESLIAAEASAWLSRFEGLPRPLTALLVGGPTKPFVFDAKTARHLLDQTEQATAKTNGTLYITTSRRTPPEVVHVLQSHLPSRARLHCWAPSSEGNPYLALLGLGDRFIVTGDSISMMVEVARLGKPLAIFPLPTPALVPTGLRRLFASGLAESEPTPMETGGWLRDLFYSLAIISYPRDLAAIHRLLIKRGLAVRLGEPFRVPGEKAPDDLPRVVARIRELIGHP